MFPSAELLLCVVFLSPWLFRIKTLTVSPLSLKPLEPKLCRGYVFGSQMFYGSPSHACIYSLWFLTDCFIKSGDDHEAIILNFSISGLS